MKKRISFSSYSSYTSDISSSPISAIPKLLQTVSEKSHDYSDSSEIKNKIPILPTKKEKTNSKPRSIESSSDSFVESNDYHENEEKDAIIILPTKDVSYSPQLFSIHRKIKNSIRGKSYFFYFYYKDDIIFSAKTKSRHPSNPIPIKKGSNPHLSKDFDFYLVPKSSYFTLTEPNTNDRTILSIRFVSDSSILGLPPKCNVNILNEDGTTLLKLESKRPQQDKLERWELDFKHKFTIPSQKNMIFVSEDASETISIRKISKNVLEVDNFSSVTQIALFGISLSVFVANIK